MESHYGLAAYGIDTGTPIMPNSTGALTSMSQDAHGGVGIAVGAGAQTPMGGANVSGRISASILMLAVIGLVAFTYKTRKIQL